MAHASFQHMTNAELPANLADVHIFVLESKGSGSGHHEKAVNVRERVDNLLSDAVAEVLLILCLAKIEKRQNGDTLFRSSCARTQLGRAIMLERHDCYHRQQHTDDYKVERPSAPAHNRLARINFIS